MTAFWIGVAAFILLALYALYESTGAAISAGALSTGGEGTGAGPGASSAPGRPASGGPPQSQSPAEKINALVEAIARAEGFYVSGSRPARNNNPGDLRNWSSSLPVDADGYTIFPSTMDGWTALGQEATKIFLGTARATPYGLDSTWFDVAGVYSPAGQQEWSTNVARALGVDPMSTVGQWAAS